MRILVISHVWEPENGVPQRRWAWLTQTLVDAGHQVHVIAPPPHYPGGKLLSNDQKHQALQHGHGIRGEYIWRSKFKTHGKTLLPRIYDQAVTMFSTMRLARRITREFPPDLVIATAPPLPSIYSASRIASRSKVPFIVDLRDSWPDLLDYLLKSRDHRGQIEGRNWKRRILHLLGSVTRLQLNRSLRRSAGIITTSESFGRVLKERGIPKTLTIYNIADLPEERLRQPDTSPAPLRLLYAGTTGRAQELSSALRSIAHAHEQGAEIELRIVGGGAHIETLKHNAQKLDLAIEFIGRVAREEVRKHYEWADSVLVQLQSWVALDTTIPSKIFEAMAYGKHITASVNGETAQILISSGSGDAVPAQDEAALTSLLVELHQDRARLLVGDRGRRWIAEHAARPAAEHKFVQFIEQVGRDA